MAKHTPGRSGWRSDASLRVPFLTLSETPTGVYYSKYPVVAFGCRLTPPSPLIVFVFDELNDRLENDTYHQHRPSDECEQPAPAFAITTTRSRAPCGPTAAIGSAMAPDSASRPSPATALPTAHNGERSGHRSYTRLLPAQPATCLSSPPAFPLDGQKNTFLNITQPTPPRYCSECASHTRLSRRALNSRRPRGFSLKHSAQSPLACTIHGKTQASESQRVPIEFASALNKPRVCF